MLLDFLTELVTGSPWAYLIIFTTVAVDAFFPVVPGETAVMTGAILAANGELSIWLVGLSGFAGAIVGDNVSFFLGRKLGRWGKERFFRSGRSRRLVDWSERQIEERGSVLVAAARFVPGGRTAATFTAGTMDMRWRRFALADAIGCLIWAAYATLAGYLGGEVFKDSLWKPLAVALAIAAVVGGAGELLRRRGERQSGTVSGTT